MNPTQILTLIDKIMDFAAKKSGREAIDSLTGKDDPFDIDVKLPGPLSKAGRIKGLNGAEAAADEIVSKLREAGVDPKDINYVRIVSDIEKRVLKDGQPLDKAKDSVFNAEKKRIDVQNTDPMPSPRDAGGTDDQNPAPAPGSRDNGPSGHDDGAEDSPSGGAQKQSANVIDPKAPSSTLLHKLGQEGGEQTLELKPEQKELLKDFDKSDGALDDILAKDPRDLTNEEFVELKKQVIRLPSGPEQERLEEMAVNFLEDKFGTGKAKFDAVGRMIDPKPIRPINKNPVPAKTPDGELLQNAVSRIGKVVAETAGDEGSANAVQGLQRGLNLLKQIALRGRAKSSPAKRPGLGTGLRSVLVPDLKTDGVVGPKTRRALKIATAGLGAPRIKEGLALGRFGKFVEDVQTGRDDTRNLGKMVNKSFAPLFRPAETALPKQSKPENLAFQATLNDLGPKVFELDAFKPIREDGLIGPKTESAFNSILPATGADAFTSRFGHNLGFFDIA